MGILWVVAFHPSWKKRRQSFFFKPRFQPLKVWNYVVEVVGPWGGRVWRECLFSVGPHSVVVHATIGDWNPTKPKGDLHPTNHTSILLPFGFWWACQSLVVERGSCWQKKFWLFVFKQEKLAHRGPTMRPYNEAPIIANQTQLLESSKHFEQLWHLYGSLIHRL